MSLSDKQYNFLFWIAMRHTNMIVDETMLFTHDILALFDSGHLTKIELNDKEYMVLLGDKGREYLISKRKQERSYIKQLEKALKPFTHISFFKHWGSTWLKYNKHMPLRHISNMSILISPYTSNPLDTIKIQHCLDAHEVLLDKTTNIL